MMMMMIILYIDAMETSSKSTITTLVSFANLVSVVLIQAVSFTGLPKFHYSNKWLFMVYCQLGMTILLSITALTETIMHLHAIEKIDFADIDSHKLWSLTDHDIKCI